MNAQTLSSQQKTSVVNIIDFTWRQNVPCYNKLTKRITSKQREKKVYKDMGMETSGKN